MGATSTSRRPTRAPKPPWTRASVSSRRARGEPQTLRHKGRSIVVPQAALGVARFSFADLCATPLGPLDYQRIAHTYHTLIIEEIPVLGPEHATRPAVSSP